MSDRDPLAPIEVLLDGLGLGDSRYATIRNLDRDFRDALAEARHNVARLTRLEAESARAALTQPSTVEEADQ